MMIIQSQLKVKYLFLLNQRPYVIIPTKLGIIDSWWAGRDLNSRPSACQADQADNPRGLPTCTSTDLLTKFKSFCEIDLRLSKRTVEGHLWWTKRFLVTINKPLGQISSEDIRTYLAQTIDKSQSTQSNALKSLKIFFRDFLKIPNVVESFRFPKETWTPKPVPTRDDLRRFFKELDSLATQTAFLVYATSGMRRNELLSLTIDDIDLEKRMIIPKNAHQTSTTKNSWVSFFNVETQSYLRRYLSNRHTDNNRIFPFTETAIRRGFTRASKKTSVHITPQVLREWFCCQLGELGVPDRYVDAFCGRTPKSVLAKHYTDYLPEKLKRIYDDANLVVGVV